MRPLRIILAAAVAIVAWRVFAGRAREALQRVHAMAERHAPTVTPDPGATSGGTHNSAAAANQDFWDDRDVSIGEQPFPIGMQPGAR